MVKERYLLIENLEEENVKTEEIPESSLYIYDTADEAVEFVKKIYEERLDDEVLEG